MACIITNVLEVVIPGITGASATSVAVNGVSTGPKLTLLEDALEARVLIEVSH